MQGILNVNKPSGVTSFSIVSLIRKLTAERRVGHAGTLDPNARGVLPILLGGATRVSEYFLELAKLYRAEIELGTATSTYDAEGEIIFRGDISGIDGDKLRPVLENFKGEIMQLPPAYSALKQRGKPLYTLARRHENVEIKPRRVKIYHLDMIDFVPPLLTIDVECGRGTYVRSLAYDLGQVLGCGAYLKNLIRLRYGPFDIKDALTVPEFEEAARCGDLRRVLYPPDAALSGIPPVVLAPEGEEMVKHGKSLTLEANPESGNLLRAYAGDGRFLAILRFNAGCGVWHPAKVFL